MQEADRVTYSTVPLVDNTTQPNLSRLLKPKLLYKKDNDIDLGIAVTSQGYCCHQCHYSLINTTPYWPIHPPPSTRD